MSTIFRSVLPAPPTSVVIGGAPAWGRYAGFIDRVEWDALQGEWGRSWLWRRLHHKRWQFIGIAARQVYVEIAVVDLGWAVTAFTYVFDRARKEVVVDWHQDGVPSLQGHVSDQPVKGARTWFRGWRSGLLMQHDGRDELQLRVRVPGMRLHAELSTADAAPFLLAVGPIENGLGHATQKSPALPVEGWLSVKGRRFELGHAVACIDSSNGLLARETHWRWACAHSPEVGFNLQQGYFGDNENALWLDGRLIPLGLARFDFDARSPMTPWRIQTDDGLLDLLFTPEGGRQADRNMGFAASHYVQPVGTFDGWVKPHADAEPVPVRHLLGVTEDHHSRW